uniref:Fungal lipase-type domain-containing protein n=1 Tax=viral metagenome TaxID=1070528 RepID=A0A6C0BR70_9ZZZZ
MFGIGKNTNNKIGDISFLTFYSVVLARLAYFTNINFLSVYLETFGENKIIPKILTDKIRDAVSEGKDLFNDDVVLNDYLSGPKNHTVNFSPVMVNFIDDKDNENDVKHAGIAPGSGSNVTVNNEIFEKEGMKHIDFYDMAKKINLVNTAAVHNKYQKKDENKIEFKDNEPFNSIPQSRVKYYSIANDSYGGTFILADTNIPNAIFVIFRGTYSAKSAGTYTRPDSLVPQSGRAGQGHKYLYGISNITYSTLHNIMSCINDLVTFLGKESEEKSIQIITTGHSLGGGLATTFSLIFNGRLEEFQVLLPDLKAIKSEIYTVSVAAPRVLATETSEAFCDLTTPKNEGDDAIPKIHFRRIAARGDPVPGLPPSGPKSTGFRHPCEMDKDKKSSPNYERHKQTYRHITGAIDTKLNINYNEDVDADNVRRRHYAPNPIKHTTYLKIKFTNAVELMGFAASSLPTRFKKPSQQSETTTIKGESVTRLITGEATNQDNMAYGMNVMKTADLRMGTDDREADDKKLIGFFNTVKNNMKTLSHDHTELHKVQFEENELHKLSAEASGTQAEAAPVEAPAPAPAAPAPAAGGAKKRRRTQKKKATKKRKAMKKRRKTMKKRRKTIKKRKGTKRRQQK